MIAGIASLGLSSPAKADLITMRGNTAGVGTTSEGSAYNLVTTTVNIAGVGTVTVIDPR